MQTHKQITRYHEWEKQTKEQTWFLFPLVYFSNVHIQVFHDQERFHSYNIQVPVSWVSYSLPYQIPCPRQWASDHFVSHQPFTRNIKGTFKLESNNSNKQVAMVATWVQSVTVQCSFSITAYRNSFPPRYCMTFQKQISISLSWCAPSLIHSDDTT